MRMWKIIVLLILVIAAMYAIPRIGKSAEIEQRGRELSITVGKHRLTASVIGSEIRDSFLIIGGGPCRGDLYFTALVSVIPLDTAERLAQRYGNFRKCNSPGASEGKRSVESMLLYAANRGVERRLRGINRLAMAGKNPIIQMTYVELNINSHTVRGEEIPIAYNSNMQSFLVKDVQLIEEDRNF